jgi:hypothetical protein
VRSSLAVTQVILALLANLVRSPKPAALVMVALGAACATGTTASPTRQVPRIETRDFASGRRLRARAAEVDGALVLREFFDVERGEPCTFTDDVGPNVAPGAGGPVYYCLPRGMAIHDGATGPFADARCTSPVALVRAAGPASYLVVRPADACATPPRVHRAAPVKFSFPYFLEGGACRGSRSPIATQAPAEELPLEGFVRAEERIEDPASSLASSPRIASLVAVAPDGTRAVVGAWDRERNEAVRLAAASTFSRWVPSRVAFQGASEPIYADPTCGAVLATKIGRDALCPLSAGVVFRSNCAEDVTYHGLGPTVDPAALHVRDAAGACVASPLRGIQAFLLGASIPVTAFAEATFSDVGGDRVRRRGLSAPGSAVVAWGELIDARTNASCAPSLARDGIERCLPTVTALVDLFADDACVIPAFTRPRTGCDESAPSFVRVMGEAGASVFQVTEELEGVFELRGDACVAHRPVVPSRSFAVTEVPVERFATVQQVEE